MAEQQALFEDGCQPGCLDIIVENKKCSLPRQPQSIADIGICDVLGVPAVNMNGIEPEVYRLERHSRKNVAQVTAKIMKASRELVF